MASQTPFEPGGAMSSMYGGTIVWKAASPMPEVARDSRKNQKVAGESPRK